MAAPRAVPPRGSGASFGHAAGGRGGGGRGGPGAAGRAGGGRGDFIIGGRGGRRNTYNATASYTFGGSALDAAPGFAAVAPVVSGGSGPYTGAFPGSLMQADTNNIAPRVGVAWRMKPGTVLRGGYGVSFNSGSYSSIARQLVGQPPFAVTNTAVGTPAEALSLTDPLATASPEETTNNYGVRRDYALGTVQT